MTPRDQAVAQAALKYAEKGWPIFPCGANKRPLTPHGFKDASTDAEQVAQWWTDYPDAMIGLPTGALSGIVVLDIDDPEEFAANCQIDLAGHTKVRTRKGLHIWFKYEPAAPQRSTARRLGICVYKYTLEITLYDFDGAYAVEVIWDPCLPLPAKRKALARKLEAITAPYLIEALELGSLLETGAS